MTPAHVGSPPLLQMDHVIRRCSNMELYFCKTSREIYPQTPCELRKFFAPQSSFNDVSTDPGKSNIELFCLSDRFASDSHISLNLRTRVGIKGVTRHEAVDGGAQWPKSTSPARGGIRGFRGREERSANFKTEVLIKLHHGWSHVIHTSHMESGIVGLANSEHRVGTTAPTLPTNLYIYFSHTDRLSLGDLTPLSRV